jgi:hypothetical protein
MVSHPGWACPRILTEGNGRCRKRQQTEDQTCTKLGPGRLVARMETHTSLLRRVYYIQWQNEVEQQFLFMFSLNINILGKTAVPHLAHFCSRGCANSSLKFIGHNCACCLLWLGLWQTQALSLFDTPVLMYSLSYLPLFKFLKRSWWSLSPNPRSCLHTMQHPTKKTRKQVNNTRRSALAS